MKITMPFFLCTLYLQNTELQEQVYLNLRFRYPENLMMYNVPLAHSSHSCKQAHHIMLFIFMHYFCFRFSTASARDLMPARCKQPRRHKTYASWLKETKKTFDQSLLLSIWHFHTLCSDQLNSRKPAFKDCKSCIYVQWFCHISCGYMMPTHSIFAPTSCEYMMPMHSVFVHTPSANKMFTPSLLTRCSQAFDHRVELSSEALIVQARWSCM